MLRKPQLVVVQPNVPVVEVKVELRHPKMQKMVEPPCE